MNSKKTARELVRIARSLLAMEFETEEALKKYLEKHPGADPARHTVKKAPDKKVPTDKVKPPAKEEKVWKETVSEGVMDKTDNFSEKTEEEQRAIIEPLVEIFGKNKAVAMLKEQIEKLGEAIESTGAKPGSLMHFSKKNLETAVGLLEKKPADTKQRITNYIDRRRDIFKQDSGISHEDYEKIEGKLDDVVDSDSSFYSLSDSAWKGYLKDSPDSLLDQANRLVKEDKMSREEVKHVLTRGLSEAKATLQSLESGQPVMEIPAEHMDTFKEKARGHVSDWTSLIEKFDTGRSPVKPHAKAKVKPGSLANVKNILNANKMDGGEEELEEMAGFKKTLGQRVPEKDVGTYYVRNAQKLKKDFLANMSPANYESAEAFAAAKKRMQDMPVGDFAKVLAAIADEDE